MINIAICDDEEEFRKYALEVVGQICQKHNQPYWSDYFSTGEDLLKALEGDGASYFDVIILDIDMPKMNGYQVAKRINELGIPSLMLFVSNREDLVFQAFEYRPFRFIRKNFFELEMKLALRKIFEILEERRDKKSIIPCIGGEEKIQHSDIMYIMVLHRKACLFMKNDRVLEMRGSLRHALELLDDVKIIQINSGCAVNCVHVEGYNADSGFLDNGVQLPVSRARMKEVKIWIRKYWGKKTKTES